MLEMIHGVPARLAALRAKLKAREGKKEFIENCAAIREEIARLEKATQTKQALNEFVASEGAVASEGPEDIKS